MRDADSRAANPEYRLEMSVLWVTIARWSATKGRLPMMLQIFGVVYAHVGHLLCLTCRSTHRWFHVRNPGELLLTNWTNAARCICSSISNLLVTWRICRSLLAVARNLTKITNNEETYSCNSWSRQCFETICYTGGVIPVLCSSASQLEHIRPVNTYYWFSGRLYLMYQ